MIDEPGCIEGDRPIEVPNAFLRPSNEESRVLSRSESGWIRVHRNSNMIMLRGVMYCGVACKSESLIGYIALLPLLVILARMRRTTIFPVPMFSVDHPGWRRLA